MARSQTVAPTPTAVIAAAAMQTLINAMAASSTGGLMLTAEEGKELVAAGYATVDINTVDDNKAFVSLTPAGEALVKEGETPNQKRAPLPTVNPASKAKIELTSDIPIPTKTRRPKKGGSIYPLETMEVGQSFHVPTTEENPDPLARITSSIANSKRKFSVPVEPAETETVKVRTYKRDAAGKLVKGEDGKLVVESTVEETRPVTKLTRDWIAAAVDASDPMGEGARIWRVAVD